MDKFYPPEGWYLVIMAYWVMDGASCEQAHCFPIGTDPVRARHTVLARLRRWHGWRDGYQRVAVLVEPTDEQMREASKACDLARDLALATPA